MTRTVKLLFSALAILGFLVAPLALAWGWHSWIKSRGARSRSVPAICSLAGFVTASLSALLGLGTLVYTHHIGGFGFYDPVHMRLLRWGIAFSATGILLGLCGLWRRNPLRWHAVIASIGTLAYWLIVTEGE